MKLGVAGGSIDVCAAHFRVFVDVNTHAWIGFSKNDNEVPRE